VPIYTAQKSREMLNEAVRRVCKASGPSAEHEANAEAAIKVLDAMRELDPVPYSLVRQELVERLPAALHYVADGLGVTIGRLELDLRLGNISGREAVSALYRGLPPTPQETRN